jgi:hypothetical protein
MSMPLFLEVHDVNGRSPQALAEARSGDGVRCLKHWLSEDGLQVALLVEAPSEEGVGSSTSGVKETTELFAPVEPWVCRTSIDV